MKSAGRMLCILLILALIPWIFTGCSGKSRKTESAEESGTAAAVISAAGTEPEDTAEETSADTSGEPEGEAVQPLIWKVSGDGGQTMYVMGTVHVGDERSMAVVESTAGVLAECDALAVEFDTVAYQKDLQKQAGVLAQFIYNDGTTVKDHMPEELYEKAVGYLREYSKYSRMFDYYNLSIWSVLISQCANEVCELETKYGIDENLIKAAYEAELPVLEIESPEAQYELLGSISDDINLLLIRKTLETDMTDTVDALYDMYEAYISGDADALWECVAEDTDGIPEDFSEEEAALAREYSDKLVYERNVTMTEKAVSYLESGDTVFFAVGAAHVLGGSGILSSLEELGYTVERAE